MKFLEEARAYQENMISEEENLLQVSATEVMNHFAIDWEKEEFIFMAHQAEDADGELISLPKEIQPETLLKALPETAESLLERGKVYRDYSFEELKELCGENEDSEEKWVFYEGDKGFEIDMMLPSCPVCTNVHYD